MPKRIDHEKRRIEILYTALEVYATKGKDTNLGLIAAQCGLSRTTVYQYFKDEADLYQYAVKYATDVIFDRYTSDEWNNISDPVEKLRKIAIDILDLTETYERQISNFIRTLDKVQDLPEIIHHRTAKLELYFSRLIRQAVKEGRMANCKPHDISSKLIILLESYLIHMVYFPQNKAALRGIVLDLIRLNTVA